jgi:hypothetical protein
MSTLSVRLLESLHQGARDMAQQEGISINQFIATAVAEKLSALMTETYLQQRARQGSRAHYDAALARVPHAEPAEYDRIEED